MPLPFPLKSARLAFALGCGALLLPVMAAAQATQYKDAPPLLLGAAWYPEQWDEPRPGTRDLETMEAAHIHLARVAEFAWSSMEPSEGHYDWGWLDHAIAEAAKHHCVDRDGDANCGAASVADDEVSGDAAHR